MLTVVVRASAPLLERALASARRQTCRAPDVAWLVLDPELKLGELEPIDDPPEARRIGAKGALSTAEGLDVAWRAGSGDVVAFFDDAVLQDGCVAALEAAMADPDVDVACCADAEHRADGRDGSRPLIPGRRVGAVREGVLQAAGPIAGVSLAGASFAVRRQLLVASGGFCPWLERLHYEELGVRLWARRARFAFAEGAITEFGGRQDAESNTVPVAEALGLVVRHPYRSLVAWLAGCASLRGDGALSISAPTTEAARRAFGRALPAQPLFAVDELASYYEELSGLDRARVAGLVAAASSSELIREDVSGKVHLDRYHVANFVDDHTTYKECDLRDSFGFQNPTPVQRGAPRGTPLELSYRGSYRIEIDAAALAPLGDGVTLTVPVPVEIGPQRSVRLRAVEPATLFDGSGGTVDLAAGLIREIPLPTSPRSRDFVVEYAFSCEVGEILAPEPTTASEAEPRYLRPTVSPRQRDRAARLLRRILPVAGLSARSAAHAIYLWLLDRVTYRQSNAGASMILDTGIGTCFHLAWLFVNLCRMSGIPARERNGALIGRATGPGAATMYSRGHSPLLHCWAEFLDPGVGWTPVEFLALCYSARIMTEHNVVDPDLRARVEAMTSAYEGYYFGSLDPYRIHAALDVNRTPTYPLGSAVPTADDLQRVLWGVRHRLTVSLCPLARQGDPLASGS